MLRRFRKRYEYNDVDAAFIENDGLEIQHSYEEPPQTRALHEQNEQWASAELDDDPEWTHHGATPQSDLLRYDEDHHARDEDEPKQAQSNLLKAIHVQVIPPSTVEGRSTSRSKSIQKLEVLSQRHRDERRRIERDNPKQSASVGRMVDTPTASTRSSTISTSTVVVKRDIRKTLLANCNMDQMCNPCVTPFVRPLLNQVSTDDESTLFDSRFKIEAVSSRSAVLGAENNSAEEDDSLLSTKYRIDEKASELDGNCNKLMRHAHAYDPKPPRRRTRRDDRKKESDVATATNVDRTRSAQIRESAALRGANKADAEYITGRAYEDKFDVELQLSNEAPKADETAVKPNDLHAAAVHGEVGETQSEQQAASTSPPTAKTDLVMTHHESQGHESARRPVTPSLETLTTQDNVSSDHRESKNNVNILRAISPMRSSNGQDPSGAKQEVSISVRGSALDSNALHRNEESQYPMLQSKVKGKKSTNAKGEKTNLFRRALTPRQRRSPSPRRYSPPRDAPGSSDAMNSSGQHIHMLKIRNVLRKSPSPSRDAPASEPIARDAEPSGPQSLSKIRRALTPKRSPSPSRDSPVLNSNTVKQTAVKRFFSRRSGSAQRGADAKVKRGSDPPPDPPASPSWKVNGNYSPRRVKPVKSFPKQRPSRTSHLLKQSQDKVELKQQQSQLETSREVQQRHDEEQFNEPHHLNHQSQQHEKPTSLPKKEAKQNQPEKTNVTSPRDRPTQLLNSHQRRNYQQYVMLKKQKSKQRQTQQNHHKQGKSLQLKSRNQSDYPPVDIAPQHPKQEATESKTVRYEMPESQESKQPTTSNPPKESDQTHQQQRELPKESQPESSDVQNLKAPVQLKKVLSSPSVMISTLTSQTMNTTNTTTTSKFWDGVEEYQPSNSTNLIGPPDRNVSFDTGLHGNPRKIKNISDEDCLILKKLNDKNKELQEFFQVRKIDENGEQQALQSRTPPRSRIDPRLTPVSPTGSGMDSAFSLNLPLNKNGYFDDSDISALAMGDSATVYHMRATAEAKKNSSSYWKEKYEKLKEETRRANQLHGMNELLLEEDEDSFLRSEKRKMASASPLEGMPGASQKKQCDDQSQKFQQKQALLRCGEYMGGKKAKDLVQVDGGGDKKRAPGTESKQSVDHYPMKSIFHRVKCFSPDESADLSLVENMPSKGSDREHIVRKVSSESELDAEDIVNELHCTRLVTNKVKLQDEAHVVPDAEVIANRLQCTRLVVDNEFNYEVSRQLDQDHISFRKPREDPDVQVIAGECSPNDNTAASRADVDSLYSDLRPLRQVGYVQRMQTPSPHLNALEASHDDALDGLACYDDPMYVMDDENALKEWNKTIDSKALADELSATASRARVSSLDGSELSESAKLIFEAALKHDIKSLREQRSRSAPRTPISSSQMRTASPVKSPPHTIPDNSNTSSVLGSGASASSEHFASNIPKDFASWFELPSPGISCIALIPILKGHLRNAIVVELLSSFDDSAKKIDAKGAHRITPRHRVNDVLEKSYKEYLDSAITSKRSSDNDYTGPVIADGDDGSIRFANASIHLGGIYDAATSHIKKREFQDAIDIYSTLLRSCNEMSGWLVEQLTASTLHNICVLHLWKQEYDLALLFSRECIRFKTDDNVGDNLLMMYSWANVGLIHYALEAHKSAVVAFRNAINISEGIGEASLSGRLKNNMGCVNTEIGNPEGALTQFEQSLQRQKDDASSNDSDTSDAQNLLSISITIFNIAVTCASQKHYHTAMKHTEASHAMQEALLGSDALVDNTLFYLNLLKKVVASSQSPDRNSTAKAHSLDLTRAIARKDEVLDILEVNPESPERRTKQASDAEAIEHYHPSITNNDEISYPMLSLGSLKVEATPIERVRECLGRYDSTLCKINDHTRKVAIGRSLLCRKPSNGTKKPGIPSKLMNFGVKTLKKLEMQTELNDNLERYGPRHPLVGQSHHSLGLVLLCIENYEESIDHFSKSIRINTHALGPKHPDIAPSLMFMALAQFALERFDDAVSSILRVKSMRADEFSNKHNEKCQITNNLACVMLCRGNLKQAEALLQEALDLQREIFHTEPEFLKGVSIILFNISFVHAKNGAFPKALIELEGALQIRQDILFEDASTGDITENMAYILAIHQLQHGSGNIDDITNEYMTMLRNT